MGFCEMLGGSVLFVESLIALWKVGGQGEFFLPIKPFLQNGMQCTFTKIAKLQQSFKGVIMQPKSIQTRSLLFTSELGLYFLSY